MPEFLFYSELFATFIKTINTSTLKKGSEEKVSLLTSLLKQIGAKFIMTK